MSYYKLQATLLPNLAAAYAGEPYDWLPGWFPGETSDTDDFDLPDRITDLLVNGDDTVIDMIAAQPLAVQQIREAAKNGARTIKRPPPPPGTWRILPNRFRKFMCEPGLPGGQDVLIVGGSEYDDELLDGFHDVDILSAILSQNPHEHPGA